MIGGRCVIKGSGCVLSDLLFWLGYPILRVLPEIWKGKANFCVKKTGTDSIIYHWEERKYMYIFAI